MTNFLTIPQEMFIVTLCFIFFAALVGDLSHSKFFRDYKHTPSPWNNLSKDLKALMLALIGFFTWAQNKDSLQIIDDNGLTDAMEEVISGGDPFGLQVEDLILELYGDELMQGGYVLPLDTGIPWAVQTGNPPFTSNAVLLVSQFQAGFACVAVTNIQPVELTMPPNAIIFTNWPYAVARQSVHLPQGCLPEGFTFGGHPVTNLYMAASGVLSFDTPKSSPSPATNGIPDNTAYNYIAVFQTPSDIVPTNGLFWYLPGTNSSLFTWKEVYLGQDTNCLATVQAELYRDGDFTCRYYFPSPTNSYAMLTNAFLIGAQNLSGGETVLHTNALLAIHPSYLPAFELRWKSLVGIDTEDPDQDGDGIPTADELFITFTDPRLADTDGDGLSDPVEVANATDPLNPDANSDNIPDGTDLTGYSLSDTNLVFRLINGIEPGVDLNLDSDGDGWADWLEVRFGTATNDFYWTPQYSDALFSVTVTLEAPPAVSGVLSIGTKRAMVTAPGSWTFWLASGQAHPVIFTAPRGVSAPFNIALSRSDALRYDKSSPDGLRGAFGKVTLPLITFDPAFSGCCHEARTAEACETYTAIVTPQVSGTYVWDLDGTWFTNAPNEVIVGHDVTWARLRFTPAGASAYRETWAPIHVHCAMAGVETNNPDRVAVNNNDDDADETLDVSDTQVTEGDSDILPLWPLGRFNGSCCQCPEHQPFASSATLVAASQNLALYTDAMKTSTFGGTIYASQAVYVEGLSPSAEPYAEKLIWQWTENNETKSLTNALTVLSVRLFPDLDHDDDVDPTDIAGFESLSSENGWVMPAATNIFRKIRLRTDVGLSGGAYTLSLSGDAGSFRVWADNSGTNTAPLLVCGQTITNGINGMTFLSGDDSDIYVDITAPGTAVITYAYNGTGNASNISSLASNKMTAFRPDIDVDSDNDSTVDTHNQGEDRFEELQPGKLLTVTNSLSEGAGYRIPVMLSTNFFGFTGVARLEQISDGGMVRVWTNTEPGSTSISLPVEWNLAQNQRPPYALWVDGVAEGGLTLKYSLVQGNVPVASDTVRLTVIPPASYAPGRKDVVCIWAPLKTYNNANTNNNVGYMDGEKLASELLSQGFTNVVWYEDLTGDTDLNLGTCTPENYLAMRDAGVFCVTSSHGSPGYHLAVFAPYSEAGKSLIDNWCSNKVGMVRDEIPPVPGDSTKPGYYYAKVSSSWMQVNWKPWLDTNKAITVWSICNSGTSGWQLSSVKEAAGGRWRIGYTDVTSAPVNYVVNELFFQYMNGKQGAGLRRTAGKALGSGSEYSAYNVRMDGNPWTTLCPAFIYPHAVFPYSLFPSPGTTASTNVGWGCVLSDTYLSDTGSASSALVQLGGATISDVRWINAGTDRKRGIGYDYDKSSASSIWLKIDPSKCTNDGLGGGRPLVKRVDDWVSGWNEWLF